MRFQKITETRYNPADGHATRVRRHKASTTETDYYIDRVQGGFRLKAVPFIGETVLLGVFPLFYEASRFAEAHSADAVSVAQ